MNRDLIDKITRAVLYEGYILYPYRPCVKSQQRWTFGGLYPQAWTDAQTAGDPSLMKIECLIESDRDTRVQIGVRFLHLIDRTVGELPEPSQDLSSDPAYRIVSSLTIGESNYLPWQEAAERDVDAGDFALGDLLEHSASREFSFDATRDIEPLREGDGKIAGLLIREQQPLRGVVEVSAVQLEARLFKLIAIIRNSGELTADVANRDAALMRTLVSTHAVLTARGGEFVSLTEPPEARKDHAAACRNIGNWPVLIGDAPARDTLLASPIILYDYPQIAPESPGDLFDGCEIDEILSLRILTLTDEEKSAAASVDRKASELLARTEALAREQLMNLHGTMRGMRPTASLSATLQSWDPFAPLEQEKALQQIVLDDGQVVKPGDRVRLRPIARADIFDMVLEGKTATVLSVEQDFENRVHVAVSVDDDPGSDLGATGKPGHRFFFAVDEIEPLDSAVAQGAAK